MYLLNINDLMDVLDINENCLKLNVTQYGFPTVADDMMLMFIYTKWFTTT